MAAAGGIDGLDGGESTVTITRSTTVQRSAEPLSAVVGDGLVLFSADRGKYYSFDEVTSIVWTALAAPTRVEDLCARLRDAFDVPAAECEADVIDVLEDLRSRDLIVVVDGERTSAASTIR